MHEEFIKDYFKFKCDPKPNPLAVIVGDKYRFTLLTSRLIRIEYAINGIFEDRPSQTVWFRNLEVPKFDIRKTNGSIYIKTEYLTLRYNIGRKFNQFTLQIQVKATNSVWRFGQRERGNLKGTSRTLDGTNGFSLMDKGLMSKQGYSVLDDSRTLVFTNSFWLKPREIPQNIDLYFFGYGRDYINCLKDYYQITGKTPLIPRFILGNWWSRYWEYTEAELKELISTFESHKIPLSVCIIDMDWHWVKIDRKYGRGWTGYTWNTDLFPKPEIMLKWLHDKNLKVALNLHPAAGIKAHEKVYKDVAAFMGVNVTAEEPVDFDITDPKFVSAYFDLVHHPLEQEGVDFWWIDWQHGPFSKMKHLDPLWMLNHLHFFDLGRDKVKRPFIFSRWGGKGNHRYPIGFSGDTFITWKSLAYQPYFTASASNVGFGWWSHDIGGHMGGTENAELYTRWVQFGIFSPIMRLHSTKNPFIKREPWKYDANTLLHAGNAMRLRHQLIPYIYTMAFLNYSEDIPLIRPMYYYSPNDERAYKFKNQYWFGTELIVAPIVKKCEKTIHRAIHSTFLPANYVGYFNFFTHEYFESGQVITRPYEISDIPVFVKAGGIIPLDSNSGQKTTSNPEHIKIEIFPGESNSFVLYEDDENTNNYHQNNYYQTKMQLKWEEKVIFTLDQPKQKVNYIPSNRHFTIHFNAIELVGTPTIQSDIQIPSTYVYNNSSHCLTVEISSNNFTRVEISFSLPSIIKRNLIREQLYKILLDSDIPNAKKQLIYKLNFANSLLTEQDFKFIMKKVKIF